ncbi:MAG: hypothetical protein JWP37_1603 [Mucilaginibacter sp.]|nr:hypothetical protein [Mucilaginibacter sp.]
MSRVILKNVLNQDIDLKKFDLLNPDAPADY